MKYFISLFADKKNSPHNYFLAGVILTFLLMPAIAAAQTPVLVSANSGRTASGNASSYLSSVSADGRYVAFSSSASDIVANDANGQSDVFVRDMQTGNTILVSVNFAGTGTGNRGSGSPSISADGRYVAFDSGAKNLTSTTLTGFNSNIYVRDLITGTTTLVSVNSSGTGGGNAASLTPVITPNGRFVAFVSVATNLVSSSDTNGTTDVLVRDLQSGTTNLVSLNFDGTAAGNRSSSQQSGGGVVGPTISADGRYVAFVSLASDLVSTSDTNNNNDVFVRDVVSGTTTLVSVNIDGTGTGNGASDWVSMSADGRLVTWASRANNLVAIDPTISTDIFIRDLQAGVTSLVSINEAGTGGGNGDSSTATITPDGRLVVFSSYASNFTSAYPDTNHHLDVFIRDLRAGSTKLVSFDSTKTKTGNDDSYNEAMSNDGRFVTFQSRATDLTTIADSVSSPDIFVHDVLTGSTILASLNSAGNHTGNAGSTFPLISANGRLVAFNTSATDLAAVPDANGSNNDVFAFPQSHPSVNGDFDGDGKTDISVWQSDTGGKWHIINSSDNSVRLQFWGQSILGDIAVPGDYDGDGRTEIAIYRPSEGNWYVLKSSDGTGMLQNWGGADDRPVPADYDGDGRTDIAVYRPAEGNWYVLQSSGGSTVQGWGDPLDKLAPGDYDGDGRADIAVYRPSDGNWYVRKSTGGLIQQNWGLSQDRPVPADYDGDGVTDFAVFRPSEGNWYIKLSSGGNVIRNWGDSTDRPIPGDYDGDGKYDIAVWRPTEGTWYLILSGTNRAAQQYLGGFSTDTPIPFAYLPQ